MATLQDIQEKVKHAQEEIRKQNSDLVREAIWPDIKSALGQRADLEWQVRRNMGLIIHRRLDEQDLHGGVFTPIIVEQLKADLQAGRLQVPEPSWPVKWLPY